MATWIVFLVFSRGSLYDLYAINLHNLPLGWGVSDYCFAIHAFYVTIYFAKDVSMSRRLGSADYNLSFTLWGTTGPIGGEL